MDISIIIPVSGPGDQLSARMSRLSDALSATGRSFEIILVPNGPTPAVFGHALATSKGVAERCPSVFVIPCEKTPGKGAAVRVGCLEARGKWIGFTDCDLPYGTEFFPKALQALETGIEFVTGNRRLPDSRFDVPVRTLKYVYRRHLLGLAFNKLVRVLFGISSTDTQAGIKLMTRALMRDSVQRMACSGFLFDIELFLVARGRSRHEVPVCLFLEDEKSTVRLLRELCETVVWLSRIWIREKRGSYGAASACAAVLIPQFSA